MVRACPYKRVVAAPKFVLAVLAVAACAVAMTLSTRAQAFERQWHAGVDLGYAALSWDDSLRSGFGAGVHGAYGLTDSFNLMLELGASSHPISEQSAWVLALNTGVGVAYTLDIVSWVPYIGLLVGGYHFSGANAEKNDFRLGFQGALGIDYRPSRNWAVGMQLRYHTFATNFMHDHYITCMGRFEWTWGW